MVEDELTLLAGPVAGRPRVMLGSEGEVYRDSWLTEPSLAASLWSRDTWEWNTQRMVRRGGREE